MKMFKIKNKKIKFWITFNYFAGLSLIIMSLYLGGIAVETSHITAGLYAVTLAVVGSVYILSSDLKEVMIRNDINTKMILKGGKN